MSTYEIRTVDELHTDVQGDQFGPAADDMTGEFQGYEVRKDGKLTAFIAPDRLISVIVK